MELGEGGASLVETLWRADPPLAWSHPEGPFSDRGGSCHLGSCGPPASGGWLESVGGGHDPLPLLQASREVGAARLLAARPQPQCQQEAEPLSASSSLMEKTFPDLRQPRVKGRHSPCPQGAQV